MSAKTAKSASAHTVAVVVYDGVDQFGLAIASEIFGTDHALGAERPWYRMLICGAGPVRLDIGLRLEVPHGLTELERADTVLVPACEAPDGPPAAGAVSTTPTIPRRRPPPYPQQPVQIDVSGH